MIYLDNNATTRPDPAVVDAMLPWLREHFANPSSPYAPGRRVARGLYEAREQVAALAGGQAREWVFTSGGTESNNTALRMALSLRPDRRRVVISAVEHSSVLELAESLEGQGYQVTRIPVDESGLPDLSAAQEFITEDTALLSMMLANNETGVLMPVDRLAGRAREVGAIVHCDAVQAAGKIEVGVSGLGAHMVSVSAHKIHGPKGVGGLWIDPELEVEPVQIGGGQEFHRRGGTENVASIVGFGVAAELAKSALADVQQRVRGYRDSLEADLTAAIPGCATNGAREHRLPQTLNIRFPGADAGALIALLERESVYCSTGSACAAGSDEPSHVLQAMGRAGEALRENIRFGLSRMTTAEEIAAATEMIIAAVRKLQENAP